MIGQRMIKMDENVHKLIKYGMDRLNGEKDGSSSNSDVYMGS